MSLHVDTHSSDEDAEHNDSPPVLPENLFNTSDLSPRSKKSQEAFQSAANNNRRPSRNTNHPARSMKRLAQAKGSPSNALGGKSNQHARQFQRETLVKPMKIRSPEQRSIERESSPSARSFSTSSLRIQRSLTPSHRQQQRAELNLENLNSHNSRFDRNRSGSLASLQSARSKGAHVCVCVYVCIVYQMRI
jgi:hypothetical protein